MSAAAQRILHSPGATAGKYRRRILGREICTNLNFGATMLTPLSAAIMIKSKNSNAGASITIFLSLSLSVLTGQRKLNSLSLLASPNFKHLNPKHSIRSKLTSILHSEAIPHSISSLSLTSTRRRWVRNEHRTEVAFGPSVRISGKREQERSSSLKRDLHLRTRGETSGPPWRRKSTVNSRTPRRARASDQRPTFRASGLTSGTISHAPTRLVSDSKALSMFSKYKGGDEGSLRSSSGETGEPKRRWAWTGKREGRRRQRREREDVRMASFAGRKLNTRRRRSSVKLLRKSGEEPMLCLSFLFGLRLASSSPLHTISLSLGLPLPIQNGEKGKGGREIKKKVRTRRNVGR